ncbi:hypothetical protein ACFQ8C_27120 [Streptomyces sp. NPDC056503]|uniref:hypothetical protein n=1 Tax=Streptomyces sp. NPDC056503 TaxID=3345842 RepID=UPI003682057D
MYPTYTTETAAALISDPSSVDRFKEAVARHGDEAERRAVAHVTRLAEPFEGPEFDLVTLHVDTDVAAPPPIDYSSEEPQEENRKSFERWESEGEIIVRALSKWWRGDDESKPDSPPWVWVQYQGGGSMARDLFKRRFEFCMPTAGSSTAAQ